MKRLSKEPLFYLLVQATAVTVLVSVIFGTYPSPITGGDSASYADFQMGSFAEMFQQIRTMGYPLFLRAFRFISPDLYLLPQVQVFLFLIAVFFFYAALRIYGFSNWAAFVTVSPFFYLRLIYQYGHEVLTDLPAAALALVTVSLVFIITRRNRSTLVYAGLALSLFLTYQFRPAYLFMIPLVPALALVLFAIRGELNSAAGPIKRLAAGTVAVSFLPFILFCLFRLVTVGHFGVVSYGGMNVIGITMQFLTKDVVTQLDEDLRPLALALIQERDKVNQSVVLPTAVSPTQGQIVAMPYWHEYFVAYENRAFQTIRKIYWGGASLEDSKRTLPNMSSQDAPVELNQIATRLAKATFLARPGIHLIYYVKALFYSVGFTIYAEPTIVPLLMALLLACLVVSLRGSPFGLKGSAFSGKVMTAAELNALILAGILFYVAKVMMVDLVNPPTGRYLLAAGMFIPSIILSSVFLVLCKVPLRISDR